MSIHTLQDLCYAYRVAEPVREMLFALQDRINALEQQAEPVAYFDFQEFKFTWAKHMKIGPVPISIKVEPMKLYSEAPQRQWVGLTDDDWAKVADMPDTFDQGVAWAAARLKERNSD